MARFLVTGGCGFIGAHLAASLVADGHDVTVLDDLSVGGREALPPGARLEVGSITDFHLVNEIMEQVDGCFHLAAIAMDDGKGCYRPLRTNLFGTLTILDAAHQARPDRPVPVIYASSAEIYGEPACLPATERTLPAPLTRQGADKLACEHYAGAIARAHSIPCVGLRLFEVYGAGQLAGDPVPGLVDAFGQALAEQREIVIPGDGGQVRDFVAVEDVVRLFRAAMARPPMRPEIVNVCTGIPTSLIDLAELMGEVLGERPAYRFVPAAAAPRASVGSPIKASEFFGWTPAIPLARGLESVLAAMKLIEWC